MNLKVVMVLIATAVLAGCAHTQNTINNADSDEIDYSKLGYVILNGNYPRNDGYFVVFDVSNRQEPRIIGIHRKRPVVEDWQEKEIFFVSKDLTEVQPDWHVLYEISEDKRNFICWKGRRPTSESYRRRPGYSPCDSRLTTYFFEENRMIETREYRFSRSREYFPKGYGVEYPVGLSRKKTVRLLEGTQMMAAVQAKLPEFAVQEVEEEMLIEQARLEEERQEQIRERQRQIEAEAMERRRQQAAIERQQREVEYTRWRRTLAVGSSTFCGFVIERNGPMVKVAVNTLLPGYPSEQWLKIDEVYPAHLGCRNRNGVLSTAADP